jgi:hypothetical protein
MAVSGQKPRSSRRYHCTMDFREMRCNLARWIAEDLVVEALSSTSRFGGVPPLDDHFGAFFAEEAHVSDDLSND